MYIKIRINIGLFIERDINNFVMFFFEKRKKLLFICSFLIRGYLILIEYFVFLK